MCGYETHFVDLFYLKSSHMRLIPNLYMYHYLLKKNVQGLQVEYGI